MVVYPKLTAPYCTVSPQHCSTLLLHSSIVMMKALVHVAYIPRLQYVMSTQTGLSLEKCLITMKGNEIRDFSQRTQDDVINKVGITYVVIGILHVMHVRSKALLSLGR